MRVAASLRRVRRFLPHRRQAPVSTLILPVPSVDEVLAEFLGRPAQRATTGIPAHITALFPFAPAEAVDEALEAAVGEVVARFAPFDFQLGDVGTFPNVLYLAPKPAAPFRDLTNALWSRWPQFPPYGGAFDDVVPHLTVVEGRWPRDAVERLRRLLPLEARADEVWLLTQQPGSRWSLRRRFALGPPSRPASMPGS
jgi:2'-5' RNA ligase